MDTAGSIRMVLKGDVDTDANALKTASGSKGADIYIDHFRRQMPCVYFYSKGGGTRHSREWGQEELVQLRAAIRGNFRYGADAPAKVPRLVEWSVDN